MTLPRVIRVQIEEFCLRNNIAYTIGTPVSYTVSIPKQTNYFIVKLTQDTKLQPWMQFLNKLRQDYPERLINTAIIGGGRGGENNSYSIANLWDGVDILIQLAWKPYIQINTAANICRISPNIMLYELNRMLYERQYHCPELFGVLPFMSFAGGLSTQSHTACCHLYEIVEGIELLLPNGNKLYVSHDSVEFANFRTPSLGMLGVIIGIDIRVKKTAKNLQRTINFLEYGSLMETIEAERAREIPLNKRVLLISPVNLDVKSSVKMSVWDWVDPQENTDLTTHKQATTSAVSASLASFLANDYTKQFATVFGWSSLCSLQEGETKTQRPDKIMGPEDTLSGAITEMELFFDYEFEKAKSFFKYLSDMLQAKQKKNEFPINTAIMVRFIRINDGQNRYRVAIDFVSFGLYLENIKHCVMDLADYLHKEKLSPSFHSGKTAGLMMNRLCQPSNWNLSKANYTQFYTNNNLAPQALEYRLTSLEKPKASADLCLALAELDRKILQYQKNATDLKQAPRKIWHACRRIIVTENSLSEDELIKLTEFVKCTTKMVVNPYNQNNLTNFTAATASLHALHTPWKEILCGIAVSILALSFIAICITSGIATFGISIPFSAFASMMICTHFMPMIMGLLGGILGCLVFTGASLSAKSARDTSLAYTSRNMLDNITKLTVQNGSAGKDTTESNSELESSSESKCFA